MRSDPDAPSRTARKKVSSELQDIGKELLELRPNVLATLPLPEILREAIVEAKRLTSFEAQRRQAQFIGKLMRRLEPEALEEMRESPPLTVTSSAARIVMLPPVCPGSAAGPASTP